MGEVLFFEPQRFGQRHAAAGDRDLPSTAVVIIFPGVRYERLDEADLHAHPKPGKRMSDKSKPRPSRR
ncbi:hypothetical protein [Mesorhizobium sp. WSM2239]|uniref:Uncharacterized protein n=2 Tax=unclassified Mesorhizobium TaxID=325217 RepID=A0AAU8D3E8_9HYPH